MGPRKTWTPIDDYVVENWDRVRELAEAFTQTQRRMRRNLRSVAEQCEAWLADRGYRTDKDRQWAEFYAWKAEWEDEAGVPKVRIAVGGVCPAGYLNVDHPCPYVGVFSERDLSLERLSNLRSRLHASLGEALGSSPTLAEEWEWLLVAEVLGFGDRERATLGADSAAMFAFVTSQFQRLIDVGDQISLLVAEI